MTTVFTSAQLVDRFGRPHVRHQIASGRWQSPHRGVVVTHNGPLSVDDEERALLAFAPPGSALGGLTSLAHDGFSDFSAPRTQLVVPGPSRRRTIEGAAVRWSTFLDERDVHPLREPRRTRPGRSVVDAASWAVSDRQARAIVIASLQQGITTGSTVREALPRRGPCKRRALLKETVLDAAGGIQSLPERDFEEIRRRAGLPRPSRQRAVRGRDRRYFLDVHIAELGLGIEIHGIPHLAVSRWDADLFRANEIVITGERLLAFSSYAVRHEADAVVDQLERVRHRLARVA